MVVKGARGSGDFEPIGWDDALQRLVQRLDALPSSGARGSLACWTRPGAGARHDLLSLFLSRFGAPPPSTFELFGDDVLRRANLLSFGHEQLPTFDLAASRYVIAFGADFLGTWNTPVAQTAAFGRMRQGRSGIRGKFVQVEPRMSLTGTSADEWIAIRPGTEGILALGLAHVMMANKLRPAEAAALPSTRAR
jgi:anaerobic selenocysteine-containing dehydrogenase